MLKQLVLTILLFSFTSLLSAQNALEILEKVDKNMSSKNRVVESSMTIRTKRNSLTITSKSYSVGNKKAFTEYLSPAREQGTKMLKLENQLWIYSPSTDRTMQISGHMLRQSVMGSDLSYEDMMDDRKLTDIYTAKFIKNETIESRNTYLLELTAKVQDLAYFSRKIWIDTEGFVPIKEELYAKSGQLLKQTNFSEVKKIQNRWFPTKMLYKDILKQGEGTEFKIIEMKFDQDIPEYLFTKAALKQ